MNQEYKSTITTTFTPKLLIAVLDSDATSICTYGMIYNRGDTTTRSMYAIEAASSTYSHYYFAGVKFNSKTITLTGSSSSNDHPAFYYTVFGI